MYKRKEKAFTRNSLGGQSKRHEKRLNIAIFSLV